MIELFEQYGFQVENVAKFLKRELMEHYHIKNLVETTKQVKIVLNKLDKEEIKEH